MRRENRWQRRKRARRARRTGVPRRARGAWRIVVFVGLGIAAVAIAAGRSL